MINYVFVCVLFFLCKYCAFFSPTIFSAWETKKYYTFDMECFFVECEDFCHEKASEALCVG